MNWLEKTYEVILPQLKVATQDYAEYIDYDNKPTFEVVERPRRIGQCRRVRKEGGKWNEFEYCIEVAPKDTKEMIDTLIHELIHWVCFQMEVSMEKWQNIGHRGEFIIIGKRFGMKAPWTGSSQVDIYTNPFINMIYEQVGDYDNK